MKKQTNILVVEDHDDTREIMVRLLCSHGYAVKTAKNAAEARVVAALEEKCDLVICDVGLPDESGDVLMSYLKREYGLKGLAISGYARQEEIDAAMRAGFDRFIAKPFEFSVLLDTIHELTT